MLSETWVLPFLVLSASVVYATVATGHYNQSGWLCFVHKDNVYNEQTVTLRVSMLRLLVRAAI